MIHDPSNASLAIDGRSLERLRADAARDPKGAARQAAGQFEAMFMQTLLKSMRDAMPKSGMWDGPGQAMYQSMLDGQLAQKVSGQPGGLADVLARQLSRHLAGGPEDVSTASTAPAMTPVATPAAMAVTDAGVEAAPDGFEGLPGTPRPSASMRAADVQTAMATRYATATPPATAAAAVASADAATANRTAGAAGRGTGLPLAPGAVVVVDGAPVAVAPGAGQAGAASAAVPTGARADAARRAWREMQALQGGPAAQPARAEGAPRRAAFVQKLWAPAQAAERATGLPASFIVGQAALETGWGRAEMRLPDGSSAHNLFGIKAGGRWKGPTVDAVTTEYVDGRAVRKVERFRAYASYEHAFRDWAGLIAGSPRYAPVVRAGHSVEGFAQGLQRAGYATDPQYADKLTRTIHQALRLQRLVV